MTIFAVGQKGKPMDDLISREQAIKLFLLTADPADVQEVRHGRWIKDKNLYKCTACNDLLSVAGWADCIPEKQIYTAFKYCPNCGARMDEVTE